MYNSLTRSKDPENVFFLKVYRLKPKRNLISAELQKSSASFDVKVEMLKRDVVAKDEIIKKLEAETEHYKNENRALKNENMVIDGRLKTYETYASKEKEEKKREFAEKLKCETEAVVNSSSDKTSCGEEHDLDPSQTNSSQKKQAKKENNSDLYLERARTQVVSQSTVIQLEVYSISL